MTYLHNRVIQLAYKCDCAKRWGVFECIVCKLAHDQSTLSLLTMGCHFLETPVGCDVENVTKTRSKRFCPRVLLNRGLMSGKEN